MTEEKKLTLELDTKDARVLAAAVGVIALVIDDEVLEKIVSVLPPEERTVAVMCAATMAGAVHLKEMDAEMTDDKLKDNTRRVMCIAEKLQDFLKEPPSGSLDN